MDEYDYGGYSDDSGSSNSEDELEYLYDSAKSLKSDGKLDEATAEFSKVLGNCKERDELRFRALKQQFKIALAQGQNETSLLCFDHLLACAINSHQISAHKVSKAIASIVDRLPAPSPSNVSVRILEKTADVFQETKYREKLWFLAKKKLVEFWLGSQEPDVASIEADLAAVHKLFKDESGKDISEKTTQLWEVYSLQMRLARIQGDYHSLAKMCESVVQLRGDISRPRLIAFVNECQAIVHFRRARYTDAYLTFSVAISNYEHATMPERIKCLAYRMLTSVLTSTPVEPLALTATQELADESMVRQASRLISAYWSGGMHALKEACDCCEEPLKSDEFVKHFVDVIKLNVATRNVPSETWKDILYHLSRDDLDAPSFVSRAWRAYVDAPNASAWYFKYVALLPPRSSLVVAETNPTDRFPRPQRSCSIRRTSTNEKTQLVLRRSHAKSNPKLSRKGTLVELAEFLSFVGRNAFIKHFYVCQAPSADFLELLSQTFLNDVRIETIVYDRVPQTREATSILHLLFFKFRRTPKLMVPYRVHSSFVSDVFLAECTVHGVAEVQFPYDPAYSESGLHPLTSAVAFEFCFAAGERGKTRTLHVACIGMAVNFIEQVVQDSEDPVTSDPVMLCIALPTGGSGRANRETLRNSLAPYFDRRVPCTDSTNRDDHAVYRWANAPQALRICLENRLLIITRGNLSHPTYSNCDC